MIVVADTTPLSELSKINKLELLQALFGTVVDGIVGPATRKALGL